MTLSRAATFWYLEVAEHNGCWVIDSELALVTWRAEGAEWPNLIKPESQSKRKRQEMPWR
jgi:hypothetical protein